MFITSEPFMTLDAVFLDQQLLDLPDPLFSEYLLLIEEYNQQCFDGMFEENNANIESAYKALAEVERIISMYSNPEGWTDYDDLGNDTEMSYFIFSKTFS